MRENPNPATTAHCATAPPIATLFPCVVYAKYPRRPREGAQVPSPSGRGLG